MTPSPKSLVAGFPYVTERLLDACNVQFDHPAAAAASAAAATVFLAPGYVCCVVSMGIDCWLAADMAVRLVGSNFWYSSSSGETAFGCASMKRQPIRQSLSVCTQLSALLVFNAACDFPRTQPCPDQHFTGLFCGRGKRRCRSAMMISHGSTLSKA
jgi:hypothetical protein